MPDREPRPGDTMYSPIGLPGAKVGDRFWGVIHGDECIGVYRTEAEADAAARLFARAEATKRVTVVSGHVVDTDGRDKVDECTYVHDPARQVRGD